MSNLLVLLLAAPWFGPQQTVPVPWGHHPYVMSSSSMEPSLAVGDVVEADRSLGRCGDTDVAPGDIVVRRRNGAMWMHRAVAGEGQTVSVQEGRLLIDGNLVHREPIASDSEGERFRETLPNGQSYLTLDSRNDSEFDTFPPTVVPPGHWFVLGDNRDASIDSRLDGPIAQADICGVVVRILSSD